jgi:hypothetical protein
VRQKQLAAVNFWIKFQFVRLVFYWKKTFNIFLKPSSNFQIDPKLKVIFLVLTQSKWVQTWHFLSLTNRPNFLFVLLDNVQTLHTQIFKFLPLFFLWLLKCSKKNIRKWTWKQEKKTKIFVLQPILDCFTILESLKKFIFKKFID